jgi:hypothetical protein
VVVTNGLALYVEEVAPTIWLVQPAPVYHVYEYVSVPPEAAELSTTWLPGFITGDAGVIAPAESGAALTVTGIPPEQIEVGDESVTLTEYDVVDAGVAE